MKSKIVLVTGGSRSGKSVFAEQLLASYRGTKAYIATAQALDIEMRQRIQRHRERRPASWHTYEVPQGLASEIGNILSRTDAVLIDCLTLYFSNFLLCHAEHDPSGVYDLDMQELDVIIKSIQSVPCKQVIFVSNELGSGIVPMDAMTRCYRDIMGCVNQRVAKEAAQVYFTVSGVTVEMKGLQVILPDVQEDTL